MVTEAPIKPPTSQSAVTYSWMPGSVIPVEPDVAGREFERIYERDGRVTPEVVLEESRPLDSPLHPMIEWDKDSAARRWQIHQARRGLSSLVITTKKADDTDNEPVRGFIRVLPRGRVEDVSPDVERALAPHCYVPVRIVQTEPELADRYLKQVRDSLAGWVRIAKQVHRFAPVQVDRFAQVVAVAEAVLAEIDAK